MTASLLRRLAGSVEWMLFPRTCEVCGRRLTSAEEVICLHCRLGMPYTGLEHETAFNTIHHRIARRPPIERAAALFYYIRHDPYVRLIHAGKYNGRPGVIRWLAAEFARRLEPGGFFDGIDIIEPVPMHWTKQLRRGYNQSEHLAAGLADVTGLQVGDHLVCRRSHGTQTRRSSYQRWLNTRDTYRVENAAELTGLHVLIVDDIITTGSTIIACAEALSAACPGLRISVLSLGLARMS